MIVVCPGCGRRYRIPETGIPRRRVRCGACGRVFTTEEGRLPAVGGAALPGAAPAAQRGAGAPPPFRAESSTGPAELVGVIDLQVRDHDARQPVDF